MDGGNNAFNIKFEGAADEKRQSKRFVIERNGDYS